MLSNGICNFVSCHFFCHIGAKSWQVVDFILIFIFDDCSETNQDKITIPISSIFCRFFRKWKNEWYKIDFKTCPWIKSNKICWQHQQHARLTYPDFWVNQILFFEKDICKARQTSVRQWVIFNWSGLRCVTDSVVFI